MFSCVWTVMAVTLTMPHGTFKLLLDGIYYGGATTTGAAGIPDHYNRFHNPASLARVT